MVFCPIMNDMWFQMDTFKYLFCLNGQKNINIQNNCEKEEDGHGSRRYFVGYDCDCTRNVDDSGIRVLLRGFGEA